jgi:hypothetical protein
MALLIDQGAQGDQGERPVRTDEHPAGLAQQLANRLHQERIQGAGGRLGVVAQVRVAERAAEFVDRGVDGGSFAQVREDGLALAAQDIGDIARRAPALAGDLSDPHAQIEHKDDAPRFSETVLSLCEYETSGNLPLKDEDEKYLKECDTWEYVAVMRTRKWSKPIVHLDTKTFDTGVYVGDMLVYKIASGKLVASYVIAATNDEKVTRYARAGESAEEKKKEWESMARADLSVNIEAYQKKYLEGK